MNGLPFETPGKAIQRELNQRGWTHDDLARLIGRHRPEITAIIADKRGITPELAVDLAAAFGDQPERWMQLDALHRLSLVPAGAPEVLQKKRLYELAPIRDMEKRGWIERTERVEEIEQELERFFGVDSLLEEPSIGVATRRSDSGDPLTPSQRAWCFRVRQIAKSQMVAKYNEAALDRCSLDLRKIAAYPQETHKVPNTLASYGIRFVVVEPLPISKVDGVALWLDESAPVIGMSLRYDRNDSFWHTLCHELAHIRHRHECPLDSDLTDPMHSVLSVKEAMENVADEEAAGMLVPRDEMRSFVLRVGPLYSEPRIVQFAHRMKIHPGIIVGQLQHRKEIGYSAHRNMLAKIRDTIAAAATTDGWGNSIDRGALR